MSSWTNNLPSCKYYKCYAEKDGKCQLLRDNKFDGKPCPFYKSEADATYHFGEEEDE